MYESPSRVKNRDRDYSNSVIFFKEKEKEEWDYDPTYNADARSLIYVSANVLFPLFLNQCDKDLAN